MNNPIVINVAPGLPCVSCENLAYRGIVEWSKTGRCYILCVYCQHCLGNVEREYRRKEEVKDVLT